MEITEEFRLRYRWGWVLVSGPYGSYRQQILAFCRDAENEKEYHLHGSCFRCGELDLLAMNKPDRIGVEWIELNNDLVPVVCECGEYKTTKSKTVFEGVKWPRPVWHNDGTLACGGSVSITVENVIEYPPYKIN